MAKSLPQYLNTHKTITDHIFKPSYATLINVGKGCSDRIGGDQNGNRFHPYWKYGKIQHQLG